MDPAGIRRIDMHVHVGLLGDEHPRWGRISPEMRKQPAYRIFLAYARIEPEEVSDRALREAALRAIASSSLDHAVCLALDPVYDLEGRRREDLSNLWVDNDYVLDLRREAGEKVLLGASVHPYDPAFADRVRQYADAGAVLLKWLPSAQQIDLADDRVLSALKVLAAAGPGGRPLPLLLHTGAEYAIATTDPRTTSYDFLSWSPWDHLRNALRPRKRRWHVPRIERLHGNLRVGLEAGACIIFAHCGLPYFAPRFLGRWLEHSDLPVVREYLECHPGQGGAAGKCYADVSAFLTPFRKSYFPEIRELPAGSLLAGSDYPVPMFELSRALREHLQQFQGILRGEFQKALIPEGNLLDLNYRELERAFPGHRMFRNAQELFFPTR